MIDDWYLFTAKFTNDLLQVMLLYLVYLSLSVTCIVTAAESPTDPANTDVPTTAPSADGDGMHLQDVRL